MDEFGRFAKDRYEGAKVVGQRFGTNVGRIAWKPIALTATLAIASIVLGAVGIGITRSSNYANIKPATATMDDTNEAKDKAFGVGRAFTGTAVGIGSLWMAFIVGLLICFAASDGGCSSVVGTVLDGDSSSLTIMFVVGLLVVCLAAIGNVMLHNSGYRIVSSDKDNHNNQLDSVWVASVAIVSLTVGTAAGALVVHK